MDTIELQEMFKGIGLYIDSLENSVKDLKDAVVLSSFLKPGMTSTDIRIAITSAKIALEDCKDIV